MTRLLSVEQYVLIYVPLYVIRRRSCRGKFQYSLQYRQMWL